MRRPQHNKIGNVHLKWAFSEGAVLFLRNNERGQRWHDKLVRAFFEYMEAQDDFFKRVTCDRRFDYIRKRMLNRVTKQAAESHPLKGLDQSVCNILLTFNNCIVLLYRQWVADGRKIPMEEMIELSTMLLENGMKRIEISKGIIISVVCTLIF